MGWTPSIVPSGTTDHDQTIYLVVNNFGHLGTDFTETDVERADLETIITDLMSGQYSDPARVVAFNTAEHWAEDVSQEVAREIQRRVDLAGDELPSSIEAFTEMHAGPSSQLSLRLS
jgi:N12 class adenine-specific DNA methylase